MSPVITSADLFLRSHAGVCSKKRPVCNSVTSNTHNFIHYSFSFTQLRQYGFCIYFRLNVGKRRKGFCGEYLSWHSSFWCLSKLERGNCFRQKVHSVGSSLTAFSTARFLQHRFLLISHLHTQIISRLCIWWRVESTDLLKKNVIHHKQHEDNCTLWLVKWSRASFKEPSSLWSTTSTGVILKNLKGKPFYQTRHFSNNKVLCMPVREILISDRPFSVFLNIIRD